MDTAAQIVLQTSGAEVVPGETARYPFTVRTGRSLPPVTEFEVSSDSPWFDPRWARVVRATDQYRVTSYLLEITPQAVHHDQYGRYPLQLSWVPEYTGAWCVLVIKPGVRLTAKPTLNTWPGGQLTLSIENFGRADIDVSISLEHHGSNWSQGWDFNLETENGPVKIEEKFELPEKGHGRVFTLKVSAAGIPLMQTELVGRTAAVSPRKAVVTAAVLAAGVAIGVPLALAGPASAKQAQSITFTSVPPASPVLGSTYLVAATGGPSGEPVTFAIDGSSRSVCSIAGRTVTFNEAGACLIEANQADNDRFLAAPQAQQSITVPRQITPTQLPTTPPQPLPTTTPPLTTPPPPTTTTPPPPTTTSVIPVP